MLNSLLCPFTSISFLTTSEYSITGRPITIRLAVIHVIMCVSTFKAAVILYLRHVIKAVDHIDIDIHYVIKLVSDL